MTRYITNTILNCHQGLCGEISKCETRSFVCSGKNSYIKYGPTPTLGAKNTKLVKDMIDERMKGYLDVTFRNSNTSINEARNKAHTKVVPKTLTCSKNAISRLSRGTLVSNEGLAGSSNICNNAIGCHNWWFNNFSQSAILIVFTIWMQAVMEEKKAKISIFTQSPQSVSS